MMEDKLSTTFSLFKTQNFSLTSKNNFYFTKTLSASIFLLFLLNPFCLVTCLYEFIRVNPFFVSK